MDPMQPMSSQLGSPTLIASPERGSSRSNQRRQGIFWLLTIPAHGYVPYPNPCQTWIRGQLELGESGYVHWQILVAFTQKKTLRQVKGIFGETCHAELSRSAAAGGR